MNQADHYEREEIRILLDDMAMAHCFACQQWFLFWWSHRRGTCDRCRTTYTFNVPLPGCDHVTYDAELASG